MTTKSRKRNTYLVGISPETKIIVEKLTRIVPPSKGFAAPSQREIIDHAILLTAEHYGLQLQEGDVL